MRFSSIHFQDAGFARRPTWRWSPLEGWSRRLTPYGMPRFSPHIRKTVVFLFGSSGTDIVPGGTGVLIGYHHPNFFPEQSIMRDVYVVSCKHVVEQWYSNVRVNTRDGGSRVIELDPKDWSISEENDLAVADITERLTADDDIRLIPTTWLADKSQIGHHSIDVGEDGFMLGMFSDVPGEERNVVVGRFGHVSLIARDDFPVECYDGTRRPVHIFDIKSRPGFSGSPVFVYRTPDTDLTEIDQGPPHNLNPFRFQGQIESFNSQLRARNNTFLKLLGVHAAQFRDNVRIDKIGSTKEATDLIVRGGDVISMPNSLTQVVPADYVLEMIEGPDFKALRDDRGPDIVSENIMLERTVYSGWRT